MKLINKKINQLESLISNQECVKLQFKASSQSLKKAKVPRDLMPFLLMYLCLNYDHIFSINKVNKKEKGKISFCTQRNNMKKKKQVRKKLLKLANVCANEFENSDSKDENQSFLDFSAKKFEKIKKNQFSDSSEIKISEQMILSIFDKIFYSDNVGEDLVSQMDDVVENQDQEKSKDATFQDEENETLVSVQKHTLLLNPMGISYCLICCCDFNNL